MHQQKKTEKIKSYFFSILREISEDSVFEELKIKIKQNIKLLEEIDSKLKSKNKKIEKSKSKKSFQNDPKLTMRILDAQINLQKNTIDELERKKRKVEESDPQNLFE